MVFNLVMEILSQVICLAERLGRIGTHKIGVVDSITHLLLADDVLFFSREGMKSLPASKEVLSDFSSFTSLQLNLSKSSLIFSASVSNRLELLNIMAFVKGSLSVKYLEVPIGRDLHIGDCEGFLVNFKVTWWLGETKRYLMEAEYD